MNLGKNTIEIIKKGESNRIIKKITDCNGITVYKIKNRINVYIVRYQNQIFIMKYDELRNIIRNEFPKSTYDKIFGIKEDSEIRKYGVKARNDTVNKLELMAVLDNKSIQNKLEEMVNKEYEKYL